MNDWRRDLRQLGAMTLFVIAVMIISAVLVGR